MNDSDQPGCRLYLITPPAFDAEAFAEALARALDGGDVACLQLRLKDVPDDAVRRAAERLMPLCHAHDVAFLVNDRPDLAAEMGADGWAYADVLPYFKRMETWHPGKHGGDPAWRPNAACPWPWPAPRGPPPPSARWSSRP